MQLMSSKVEILSSFFLIKIVIGKWNKFNKSTISKIQASRQYKESMYNYKKIFIIISIFLHLLFHWVFKQFFDFAWFFIFCFTAKSRNFIHFIKQTKRNLIEKLTMHHTCRLHLSLSLSILKLFKHGIHYQWRQRDARSSSITRSTPCTPNFHQPRRNENLLFPSLAPLSLCLALPFSPILK